MRINRNGGEEKHRIMRNSLGNVSLRCDLTVGKPQVISVMDTDPWRFAPHLRPEMDEQFHLHVHMTSQSIPYVNPPYVNLTRKGTIRKTRMEGGSSDLDVDVAQTKVMMPSVLCSSPFL